MTQPIQFNAFMPNEGPDAWVAPTTLPEEIDTAFLPLNTPIDDGQEMTVLGQKMQFFRKYGSDDAHPSSDSFEADLRGGKGAK